MGALEPRLHFLLVGVPKAGTTSLHAALKHHPDLTLPRGKEVPFFDLYPPDPGRWRAFAEDVFPKPWKMMGKITPQYWFHPRMPEILSGAFPDLRILVLLRNPVDRFYSEYAMYVRRGAVREDLPTFLERAFRNEALAYARQHPLTEDVHPGGHLLVAGEYARILRAYRERFDRVGVFFFEELVQRPEEVLTEIQRFIGVTPRKLPFERHHSREVPRLEQWIARMLKGLRAFPPARGLGKILLGGRRHDVNWFILTREVQAPVPPPLDEESRERLRQYYAPHVAELAELLGRMPPWEEFR